MKGPAQATGAAARDPFAEDPYGSLKRLRVFRSWIEDWRARRGGRPLALLDVGCGTGDGLTRHLGQRGDRVLGIDPHAASIEEARRRGAGAEVVFACSRPDDLLERGERYDVVVCSEVLEHLADPGACLRVLRRLMADGGLLLVSVPNGYGGFENLRRLERILERLGVESTIAGLRALARRLRGSRSQAPEPGFSLDETEHVHFFRLDALRALFSAADLALEEVRGRTLLCGPYADFWLTRLPGRRGLLELNAALADRLPLVLAADWMFRLRGREAP